MNIPFSVNLPAMPKVPVDRYNIIFLLFLINGIGTLLPWNMLINADNYFVNYKLNVTESNSPALDTYRNGFLSYLGIASKVPNIMLQILNMFINSQNANLSRRISITLIVQIIVFMFIIVLAIIDTSKWPEAFFWITMASAAFINLANGVYQGCIYGLAAIFPMKYTNSVTIGMNISGTLAAILMILSIAISPSPKIEAIVFFSCAVILLLVCLVGEYYIRRNVFYRYYSSNETVEPTPDHIESQLEITNCSICFEEISKEDKTCSKLHLHNAINSTVTYGGTKSTAIVSDTPVYSSAIKKYLYIFSKIWVQLLNIILIYAVSLSLFPAVHARILSVDNLLNVNYFAPVFCFLSFNLFATVGNFIAQYVQWPSPKYIIIFTVARLAFIPYFLYCNYHPSDTRTLPIIFGKDWMFIVGSITMALSSGYLSSLCMMIIPKCVHPQLSATAGMLAALTIILGILIGINISLVYPLIVSS